MLGSELPPNRANDVYDGVQFPTPQNAFIEDNLPV